MSPGRLEDYHVHSTWSADALSPLEDNLAKAAERGLGTICMVEHVRRSSTYVPEFAAAANELRPRHDGLTVLIGVEAKILDVAGTLDMPAGLVGLDHVLVADHQLPVGDRCCTPREVLALLETGTVTPDELIEGLVEATVRAVKSCERPILAHLFSILPKVGLGEADIPDAALAHLARGVALAGAWVEVNEKWKCPSERTLRQLVAADVRLVLSTDAHHCDRVGAYAWARDQRDRAELLAGTTR
jgi:putative hydrolase